MDVESSEPSTGEPEPQRHIGYLIRRAQQAHAATWTRTVSAETSSVQYTVLVTLDRRSEASQRQLCEDTALDRSTIATLVAHLEQRGLVQRHRSTTDARRNIVTLTPRGAIERNRLKPLVEEAQRQLVNGMSPDAIRHLRASLLSLLTHRR